jgi:muramoyltetrapeptide carboxypeptidase
MIRPEYLKKGDTIGIIAPSRKINEEDISVFLNYVEKWGLKVKFGKHLFDSYNQFAGTDKSRAADLQEMIEDEGVKAVVCARGGYGTIRTLVQTDFSFFEKRPKWIAGFSDITVLHAYLGKFLNCESIHSLMPINFQSDEDTMAIESFRKTLFGEELSYEFPFNHFNKEGEVSAEIVGGNLSILYSLNGTPYFPDVNNKILFIEDVDEYLYHIDRMMMNLMLSGVFNKIKGLVVGGFSRMNDNEIPFGKTAEQIIAEIIEKYDIPVAFSFPSGHISSNKTLIFGRQAVLRVGKGKSFLNFNP